MDLDNRHESDISRPQLDDVIEHDFLELGDGNSIPTEIAVHLKEIDRIAQEVKADAGCVRDGEWVSDDWCGQATERVSEYLDSVGMPNLPYFSGGEYEYNGEWIENFGGTDWDRSHAHIVLIEDGTIIDPTITQFTKGQFENYPHHEDVPNVAVIPLGHELGKRYEAHQTGHDFATGHEPDWVTDLRAQDQGHQAG